MMPLLALLLPSALGAPASPSVPVVSAVTPATGPLPLVYYNGTIDGAGTPSADTVTVNLPTPPNGTVWDLVSLRLTLYSPVTTTHFEQSYMYDSTCAQQNIAPASSNCVGIYGPNVDAWGNAQMGSGHAAGNITGTTEEGRVGKV